MFANKTMYRSALLVVLQLKLLIVLLSLPSNAFGAGGSDANGASPRGDDFRKHIGPDSYGSGRGASEEGSALHPWEVERFKTNRAKRGAARSVICSEDLNRDGLTLSSRCELSLEHPSLAPLPIAVFILAP